MLVDYSTEPSISHSCTFSMQSLGRTQIMDWGAISMALCVADMLVWLNLVIDVVSVVFVIVGGWVNGVIGRAFLAPVLRCAD